VVELDGTEKMLFACRITKARMQTHTHTHTHNIYFVLLFHGNNVYTNGPQRYVLRTLSVLLNVRPGGT